MQCFNLMQGAALVALALAAECAAIEHLVPVLLSLGCLLILSSACHLTFQFDVSTTNTAMGLLVNLLHLGILVCLVWLCVLTWGRTERLWDGGEDCDGWVFGFVFVYTIFAAVEVLCFLLCLRRPREGLPSYDPDSIL